MFAINKNLTYLISSVVKKFDLQFTSLKFTVIFALTHMLVCHECWH